MSTENESESAANPLIVYGTTASYYTGKLEAYLRAKGISYRLEAFTRLNMERCVQHTGIMQIPQVECPDGSWLVDTTLILDHLEQVHPHPAVSPRDPALKFISRLLEDFADEWLWRPAMYYRWVFPETARLMSAWLAEHLEQSKLPMWMKRRYWRRRQYKRFVAGDGVTETTRNSVETAYLETLAALEPIFDNRPYLLGERPTEADFGFFASLFRHFFSDPAPARLMRAQAPAVQQWVARMWNLTPERIASQTLPEDLPQDLAGLLKLVTRDYLPYLAANANAYAEGKRQVSYAVQGVLFEDPVKPYRVWCRDRLQRFATELDAVALARVQQALGSGAPITALMEPSPKPVEKLVPSLPLRRNSASKPVDSWWRDGD